MSEDFPGHLGGFRPGSVLAGYRLEAYVATGGMGVVFRARDGRLGRVVALKILAPALAADPGFRRRFIAESRAAASVDDPHIIPVYEADEADGVLFIAMRFVPGGDLRGVLEREGVLPPERAMEFISPVASALDAAHAAGLVHRDVKPGNILVDARAGRPDHVYLSDFGASKGAMTSVSLTGQGFLGTPDYAAPEQVNGVAVDGRTDEYALACVSWRLLTGMPPFERDHGMAVLLARLSAPPPSLVARRPDLPGGADAVLARAMAKTPDQRYESCGAFADALRETLGLAPYHSRGSAAAPAHQQPFVAMSAEISSPEAAGNEKTADLPNLAGTVTIGPPRGGPDGDAEVPAAVVDSGPNSGDRGANDDDEVAERTATLMSGQGTPAAAAADSEQAGDQAAAGLNRAADELARLVAAPDTVGGDTPDGTRPAAAAATDKTIWLRRRRLPAIAVGCAIVVAAGVIPLVLTSAANPPKPGDSPKPTHSVTHSPAKQSGSTSANRANTGSSAVLLTDPDGSVVNSVAFGPGGTTLAVADGEGNTYLWDLVTDTISVTLTDPASGSYGYLGVSSVAFAPGGTTLAVGDSSGTYLWDLARQKISATLTDPATAGVTSVAFSANGTTLAVGDSNDAAYLWDPATQEISTTLTEPDGNGVTAVACAPDGTTLAVGNDVGITTLWDPVTQTISATLTDPASDGVTSVAFGPGGILAVADGNGSTYLWDTPTRRIIATLTDPASDGVTSVAFGPGGTTLAAADRNGNVYLWDVALYGVT